MEIVNQSKEKFILAAGEVGVFTVCPESWRLKSLEGIKGERDFKAIELGRILHKSWSKTYDDLFSLNNALKGLFTVSCAAVLVLLLLRSPRESLTKLLDKNFAANLFDLAFLMIGVGFISVLVIRALKSKSDEGGLGKLAHTIGIDGSTLVPGREYISKKQGLAGKPDALVEEEGMLIPVERKPLAKKLRDRYVAQLLIYMRLVEEFEGRRPAYGYLLLGPNCRKIKIENSIQRQAWVEKILEEMREVLKTSVARTDPHPKKCEKCPVRGSCREWGVREEVA